MSEDATTRQADVIDMLQDRGYCDALWYRGYRFVRAHHRGPGGRPLTRAEARATISEALEMQGVEDDLRRQYPAG